MSEIFDSNAPVPADNHDANFSAIPSFTMAELNTALRQLANLRCADEQGLVAEMIKHGSPKLKHELIKCFNQVIQTGIFDDGWQHSIFPMLPKDGGLTEISNWRPIAILPIPYKLFARLLFNRISPGLLARQSPDQHAFTPGVRIEDALVTAEVAIEYAIEFNTPLWLLSMDLRKAFDT